MTGPTQDQIDDVLNKCLESEESGTSVYPGMTYEQGVRASLDWISGDADDPFDDG